MGSGLNLNFFSFGKSSQKCSKSTNILDPPIQCAFCLLKVVNYYDLSVLTMDSDDPPNKRCLDGAS